MRSRPSKFQNYMDQAEVVARLSHDAETQVGAVLVKNSSGSVVAEGFNGFVRGAPDGVLPDTRPAKYRYILHAEHNLLTNCARHGISTEDSTVVCTLTPCVLCMRLLWQSGINRVVARDRYRDFDEILAMDDLKVNVEQTPEGFWKLTYGVKSDSNDRGEQSVESKPG